MKILSVIPWHLREQLDISPNIFSRVSRPPKCAYGL